MTYPEALDGLLRTAERCGLDPQPERPVSPAQRDALLPVFGPGLLQEIETHGYPGGLEVPWTAEDLFLYPLERLAERQAGYRFDARTLAPSPAWDPRLHVLADLRADPISIHPDGSLWAAVHGVGSWTQRRVADGLPELFATLDAWLRFFVLERGREIFTEDFDLLDDVPEAIRERILASLSPECRAGFAEILFDL